VIPDRPRSVWALEALHRRLVLGMALASLIAFGTAVDWVGLSPVLALAALVIAMVWSPPKAASTKLENAYLPIALLLLFRSIYNVAVFGGDVVTPVIDPLLLLMCAEGMRSLEGFNDVRIYGLSFALMLAATAYRPGIVFGIAFLVYIALASPALTLGHLRRKLVRYGGDPGRFGNSLLWMSLGISGVTLLASVIVFLLFPRASQGFSGRGEVPSQSIVGFSNTVSIGEFGSRIQANPQVAMRVEFPRGRPADIGSLHWRGSSFDRFDGQRWHRSRRIGASSSGGIYRYRWPGPVIEQVIYGERLDVSVLFTLHPTVEIAPQSPITPFQDAMGDFSYIGSADPVYRALSLAGRPSADSLRAALGAYRLDRSFKQLPPLPDRVKQLADSLTAGLPTRYDKVVKIESYLRTFRYTLDLPANAREATLDYFLFERRAGHCEYFSTAMVILLREVGIEARNVNGFLGGSWSEVGNYLAVTQNDAHSWVEVWFPGYGWVPFDPTPAGVAEARAAQWFWPGRFFFDAMQHRWGKWVLDYDLASQTSALSRAMEAIRPDGADDEAGTLLPSLMRIVVGALPLVLLGGLLWMILRARRDPVTAETRLYLRLVRASRRAGLVSGQVAPLELAGAVSQKVGGAAGSATSRLVDLYVRARFAGEPLGEDERTEMARALAAIERALARIPAAEVAAG
jgi:protein-glutamine gamma-glutamyltransferase